MHKKCRECGEDKPIQEFGIDKYKPDGHNNRCRECVAEIARGRYENGQYTDVGRDPHEHFQHSDEWLMQEWADLQLGPEVRKMLLNERVLARTGYDLTRGVQ